MLIGSSRLLGIYAFSAPADMRKGFDGLAALVREQIGHDPTDGSLYLFVSRNRLRAKVLLWDGTGLCLYAKRLEQGRFAPLWGREEDGEVRLSMSELALYLEGSQEVGRRPFSPPEIDPNRQTIRGLSDNMETWSTSKKSAIPKRSAPSPEPRQAREDPFRGFLPNRKIL